MAENKGKKEVAVMQGQSETSRKKKADHYVINFFIYFYHEALKCM